MAENFVPEHLLKDELRFEVQVRGAESASDVLTMRSQLRGLFKSRAETSWNTSLDLEKELDLCRIKIEEWEELAEVFLTEPPVGPALTRIESRLLHWLRRLEIVGAVEGVKASELAWIIEAKGKLQSMFALISGSGKSSTLSTPLPAATSTHVATASLTSAVPSPPAAVVPDTAPLPSNAQCPAAMGTIPVNSGNLFGSPNFVKLPNPLTPLLQALPVVDGLDVDQLLFFFGIIFRMKEFPGIQDSYLLSLILPYCRSPLADRLNVALMSGWTFDEFHYGILDFFVPQSMRERLKVNMVYRPQGFREPLPEFVAAVKQAGRVLRLGLSESDMVQIILDGINPEERSRLVFAGRPSTFLDLDRLCVTARSVQFLDQQRGQGLGYQAGAPSGTTPTMQERPHPPSTGQFALSGPDFGQRGHFSNNGPRYQGEPNSRPKNGGRGGLPPR